MWDHFYFSRCMLDLTDISQYSYSYSNRPIFKGLYSYSCSWSGTRTRTCGLVLALVLMIWYPYSWPGTCTRICTHTSSLPTSNLQAFYMYLTHQSGESSQLGELGWFLFNTPIPPNDHSLNWKLCTNLPL